MSSLLKRILITLAIAATPLIIGLLLTYQVIHIDWVSFMEIQPSFQPMEDPLPVPPRSVPVQGIAYVPGAGAPGNPISADQASLDRGKLLYDLNCSLCHGPQGKGDGPVAAQLIRKPPDLTSDRIKALDGGDIFLVITNGVNPGTGIKGGMPALRENLAVGERWDIVNYVHSLQP
jgi:mono/diheme cytochrome c family protein